MRREELKALYRESPVPVYEVPMVQWAEYYPVTFGDVKGAHGYYKKPPAHTGLPPAIILIEKSLPNYNKARTFLHELGHAKRSPKEWLTFRQVVWEEVYAERFAMRECVRRGLKKSARKSLQWVVDWACSDDPISPHCVACKRLLKDKAYRRYVSKHLRTRKEPVTMKELDAIVRQIRAERKARLKAGAA